MHSAQFCTLVQWPGWMLTKPDIFQDANAGVSFLAPRGTMDKGKGKAQWKHGLNQSKLAMIEWKGLWYVSNVPPPSYTSSKQLRSAKVKKEEKKRSIEWRPTLMTPCLCYLRLTHFVMGLQWCWLQNASFCTNLERRKRNPRNKIYSGSNLLSETKQREDDTGTTVTTPLRPSRHSDSSRSLSTLTSWKLSVITVSWHLGSGLDRVQECGAIDI